MEVKWIGNTSFLIKTSLGRRILLDPIQINTSIKNYDFNLDIITFSHMYNKEILNFSENKKVKINATLRGDGLISALPHTPSC